MTPTLTNTAPPSVVDVFGTVFNETAFLYRTEKNFDDYLKLAGGVRPQADRLNTYVVRADGSVVRRGCGFFAASLANGRVMPDIVVPEDCERTTWTKDLTRIFRQFGLRAAAPKVIKD